MCNIFATLPFFKHVLCLRPFGGMKKKITIYEKCSKATSLQNQKSNESEKKFKEPQVFDPWPEIHNFLHRRAVPSCKPVRLRLMLLN